MNRFLLVCALIGVVAVAECRAQSTLAAIALVANAANENASIAPNTWVEIKGSNLAPAGDSRSWQSSDFVNNQMPTVLDGVSVTVNGKSAYVYYISPSQVNVLTPPDSLPAAAVVQVSINGLSSPSFTVPARAISPSFFVFNGGPYVAATHVNGNYLGPAALYPGTTTPAKPGEIVVLYANGFGPTSTPVVSGSSSQSGTLSPLPIITIGGNAAMVQFAGLVAPGEFQFNVVIPANASGGDNTLTATYQGFTTPTVSLITIAGSTPPPSDTFYVSPNGNDSWSGTLAAPNAANTDGPWATFDHARAVVQSLDKSGLSKVSVQFRDGTYYLPATQNFAAADSGSATTTIVYQNYPGESPAISGGVRVQNWTNAGGNKWKTALPAATKYFEQLFYNGARRLRPRVGGYLGTYLRVAATVYLDAPGPPATTPDPNCSAYIAGSGWECFDRFQYNAADPIVSTWKNLAPPAGNPCGQPAGNAALAGDIEVLDFEKYTASKLRISCVDSAHHIVYMTGPTGTEPPPHTDAHGFIVGHRYLVENVQDQLIEAGQWFLDRSTTPWTLTYLAESGENPNNDTVIIPQIAQVVVASNLQYVTFQGLTFEHDNYTLPAAGHPDVELPLDISAAVSFQDSQHITFDSGIVRQTSGAGLEFLSCVNEQLVPRCISSAASVVTANNVVQNSAFYDLGEAGVRIGIQNLPVDTDANVPQFTTVQNNVVEGYGRVFPNAWGITQGEGHDNTYTHNDVYDGYHVAIGVCECTDNKPNSNGTSNNTISFNHVYNLFQGIMNDAGSLYFGTGNSVFTSSGNKVLNNKVHDVSDASALDPDGYGGHGIYLDNQTGLVDVENNLVYRVSGYAVNFPKSPFAPNLTNTVKNNILAFARLSMINDDDPYPTGSVPVSVIQTFAATNNLFYFDRKPASSPSFYVQGGCTYSGGFPYTQYQQWNSNLYWRTDGAFASDAQAFHVQSKPGANVLCSTSASAWTFYTFAAWQKTGEDAQSGVQDPGFANPAYPTDDYSLTKGSPGVGFVVFDPNQAGRSNPVINPPAVPATFPTKTFNPATDY
jgi:uncharacterized protein (TIGR03437 family)